MPRKLVSVPVLKPLTYQGRSYVRGEMVSMKPIDAVARARKGQITLTKGAKPQPQIGVAPQTASDPAVVVQPEPVQPVQPEPAEPDEAAASSEDQPSDAAGAPRRSRRYQRRDLTAEGSGE